MLNYDEIWEVSIALISALLFYSLISWKSISLIFSLVQKQPYFMSLSRYTNAT